MRVVLDTNTLISALISPHSPPDRIYQAWRKHRFQLITSKAQLEEFRRASHYPKLRVRLAPHQVGTMMNYLHGHAVVLDKLPALDVSPDPDDNYILAMAMEGKADYLVTGDKAELLAIRVFGRTRIVGASEFLKVIE